MTKYRIKFWLRDGKAILWERFGNSMEECFALTKIAIEKEYGDKWNQSAAICGPQNADMKLAVYAF
jgi:hypothetical protein